MFRIRDAVFPQSMPGFLSADIFRTQAGPASRFFVAAGCEDLGGGLRYEIAPFQGWFGLGARYSQGVALGYRMAPRWGDNIEGVLSRGVAPGYRRAPRWGEGAAMPDGEPMLLRTMGRLVRGGWRRCRGDCPRLARGTKTCRERSRRLGFGIGRGSGGRQKHPENVGGGVGIAVGRKEVCE